MKLEIAPSWRLVGAEILDLLPCQRVRGTYLNILNIPTLILVANHLPPAKSPLTARVVQESNSLIHNTYDVVIRAISLEFFLSFFWPT